MGFDEDYQVEKGGHPAGPEFNTIRLTNFNTGILLFRHQENRTTQSAGGQPLRPD
jgi:hypothetical protein